MRRYRLRTLLLVTALVAVGIATFKPFEPNISVPSVLAVPVAEPYSNAPLTGKYRQFRISVQNDGRLPVWLTPNDTLVPDYAWESVAALRDPTYVDLDIYGDNCTKLGAGQSRVYDVVVHAGYRRFRLGIQARDWRGRDRYKHLGFHEIPRQDSGEPSVATEPGLQDFTNGQSTLPAR